MKNRKHILAILSIIFVISATILLVPRKDGYADFGDFSGSSDYGDYGSSSSDYGSSSYSSGSSWSSSSYDYNSSSSSDPEDFIGFTIFLAIVVGVIIFLAILSKISTLIKKSSTNSTSTSKPAETITSQTENKEETKPTPQGGFEKLKESDPNFSEEELKTKISNLYIQFQQAWEKKDLSTLRPYLTDIAYAQYDRQLDNYRKAEETNKIDHPTVLSVDLESWSQENGKDTIVARVRTRIIDYVVSDKTGEVVRGSKTAEKFMEYKWILERSSDVKTTKEDGATVQKCPNCGGSININQTAKCPYCRRIATTDKFNWLVKEIKGVSQRTSGN